MIQYILKRIQQAPIDFLINSIKSLAFISNKKRFRNRVDLIEYCGGLLTDGIVLEFGVFEGKSINHIAATFKEKLIYGFDCFTGLPEAWGVAEKGFFKTLNLPKVHQNVSLIPGLFEDTLPKFLSTHNESVAFAHLDADLYSSTKSVLFALGRKNSLHKGSVLLFDDFFNYLGWWRDGEYKAFTEFVKAFKVKFRFIGYSLLDGYGIGAAAIQIL